MPTEQQSIETIQCSEKIQKRARNAYKRTPQMIRRLAKAREAGLTLEQASKAAGLSRSTLHQWMTRHPSIRAVIDAASERAREKGMAAVAAAGEKDWRAWEAWLKLAFAADYNPKASAPTSVNVAVGIVCSEEQRARILAQRERLLGRSEAPQLEAGE